MIPVVAEKERPDGSDGEIDQEVTVPPVELGVAAFIAEPLVKVRKVGL
tara:strand:- start:172 stop:315 length:144 start_codon:yes stop_codon:yes gene_type:complete